MKKHLILFSLIATFSASGQEEPKFPFAQIEQTPIYRGCNGDSNEELKLCTSDKVAAFVNKNFRIRKGSRGLEKGVHKIYVNFKIDKIGKVVNVRSTGPNKELENEAVRVINKLPRFTPGQQKGKNVGVLYALPITFRVD